MSGDNKKEEPYKQEVDLEKLLKKNLVISQEILDLSRYIRKYVFWKKITGIIRVIIILIPIILGIIYLPPIIEDGLKTINNNLNNPLSNIINSNCENGQ
jgi:hypothetical protein